MSAIGGKYDYDVFFSYAWAMATDSPALRDWCRQVADTINVLLQQRFNVKDTKLKTYLDRDAAKSGQDLDVELKAATEKAGVFVVMVSDHYDTDYCQKEMNWFCDRMAAEGAQLADRLCIIRIQESSSDWWPARFMGSGGNPMLYLNFCNDRGQPTNMAQFVSSGKMPDLAGLIEKAALEIGDKIGEIAKTVRAREVYDRSQQPPNKPILFFEAEDEDRDRWNEFRRLLKVGCVVVPGAKPSPATAVPIKKMAYANCDGLVMLRSREGDEIGDRIRSAYLQRRALHDEKEKNVPWALLDELDEPPDDCEAFEMPRVLVRGDWLPELQKTLWMI